MLNVHILRVSFTRKIETLIFEEAKIHVIKKYEGQTTL